MAKGRTKKRSWATYNISGLRNQSKHSFSEPIPPQSEAPSPDGDESAIDLEEEDLDLDLLPQLASDSFDSLKTNLANECIFLPKFHCELNPIEIVHVISIY